MRCRVSAAAGWCPVTLALVADLWPPERRSLPLGVIGGVQELGSVLGPLYGGLILTVATWQTIFWLNLPIAAVLALGLVFANGRSPIAARVPQRRFDRVSIALAALALAAGCLSIAAPSALVDNDTTGLAYSALGGLVWLTPIALAAAGAAVALILWELRGHDATRALIPVRRLPDVAGAVDWPGAALLAIALATVIVSFSARGPVDRRDLAGGDLVAAARRPVSGGLRAQGAARAPSAHRCRRVARRAAPTARCSPTSQSGRR